MRSYKHVDKELWPIPVRHLNPDQHVWIIDYEACEYIVMLREFRVYMLTCLPTGERYIGVTEGHPRERLNGHAYTAFHPKRNKTLIQKAIAEYGIDAFTVETIGIANSLFDARELEKKMIRGYQTMKEDGGFNVAVGGGRIGPTRIGLHYLCMYERGEGRVVGRIPRIVKERKKKSAESISPRPGKKSHLRLVEMAKPSDDNVGAESTPWLKLPKKLRKIRKRRLLIAPK